MKHLNTLLVAALILFSVGVVNAQDEDNPWAIEVGLNAVDVYPVGLNDEGRFPNMIGDIAVKGDLFDEYFNANDHWNILPSVSRLSVGRYLGSGFTLTAAGAVNKISRIGNVELNDDVTYYSADGEIEYSLRQLFGGGFIDPTIGVGGGYTWVDDIGFGTANVLAGVRFWVAENLAFSFQSAYKHSFEESYGIRHFQHSAGIMFKFGGKDTDGDGIYDKNDECPETAGLAEFNGCPDTDGDGIEDRVDACPETPGLAEFNGCPDTDGDGISDPEDACPSVPGLASLNGCPDADGDGITDGDDSCPDTPGPAANNGCPWPDEDGDGVLDKDDECPGVAGTVANNGCPEVTVDIINQLNDYSKTILFDFAKSSIRQESYGVLQQIADVMNEYPTANFEIGGHTDSIGNEASNQKLSEARAKSVHDYLVSIGMDDSRLHYNGYGESRPIATNNTAAGRQENRRVEITVKE